MIKKILKWFQDIRLSFSAARYNTEYVGSYEAKYIAMRLFEKYPVEEQYSVINKINEEIKNLQINKLISEKEKVKEASRNINLIIKTIKNE